MFGDITSHQRLLENLTLTFSQEEAEASLIMTETKFKARIITVAIADPNPGKRSTTTILAPAATSTKSASPAPNGSVASPPSAASPQAAASNPDAQNRAARTIALFNIPDTINTARLQSLLAPHGTIEEITLKPKNNGAIVVLASAAEAGTAALAITGVEIAPGRKIETGSVAEMYKHKAEVHDANPGVKKSAPSSTTSSAVPKAASLPFQAAGSIRRPGVTGGSRRGGLGFRRGGAVKMGLGVGGTNEDPDMGKSNDEFRRMFVSAGTKKQENAGGEDEAG